MCTIATRTHSERLTHRVSLSLSSGPAPISACNFICNTSAYNVCVCRLFQSAQRCKWIWSTPRRALDHDMMMRFAHAVCGVYLLGRIWLMAHVLDASSMCACVCGACVLIVCQEAAMSISPLCASCGFMVCACDCGK